MDSDLMFSLTVVAKFAYFPCNIKKSLFTSILELQILST